MSDQQPMAPPMAAPGLDEVLASLLHATDTAARSSSGAGDIREVREYGAAALSFAQAYAILHPNIVAPQGVAPQVLAASVPQQQPALPEPPKPQNAAGKA